jgi:hypothetical protein
MSLIERSEYQIEVVPPFKVLNCRRADIIERDDVEIGRTYHRHTKVPGEDMTGEPAEMQTIAAALWTPEVIAAYQAGQPLPPVPPEPGPDYYVFWEGLMASSLYAAIREQSMVSLPMNTLGTEFIALLGDAKAGRPYEAAIQASMMAILSTGKFTPEQLAELAAVLAAANLDGIYVLP